MTQDKSLNSLVLTVIGADRPGLVEALSETVAEHGASWLESRMAHLSGHFAGLLRVSVSEDRLEALREALRGLESRGLSVMVAPAEGARAGRGPGQAPASGGGGAGPAGHRPRDLPRPGRATRERGGAGVPHRPRPHVR